MYYFYLEAQGGAGSLRERKEEEERKKEGEGKKERTSERRGT